MASTRTLVSLVAITMTVLVGFRTASPTADPAHWQAGLDVQLGTIEAHGTSIVELAAELRTHLGLPQLPLEAADRCDIAVAEHGHGGAGVLPEHPEIALEALVTELETTGPPVVQDSLALLRERGGEVRWSPQRVAELNAVAFQTRTDFHVGADWLVAALSDVTSVQATIAHELEGHLRYGDYLSCRILATALVDVDPADKDALFRAYAYAESEVYAELKELEVHTASNIGDAPREDIARQVDRIRATFPSEMAEIVITAMADRFDADETLSDAALDVFGDAVGG